MEDNKKQEPQDRRKYTIQIDETTHAVMGPLIDGARILELAGKEQTTHFVTQILIAEDDIVIGPGDQVDISKPGRERFTTVVKEAEECHITVNTRSKQWDARTISFEQVVALAFDTSGDDPTTTAYTVSFRCGHSSDPDGSMVAGGSVTVRCGMIFDVDRTDRS